MSLGVVRALWVYGVNWSDCLLAGYFRAVDSVYDCSWLDMKCLYEDLDLLRVGFNI